MNKFKKGDVVQIMRGKDKGKQGEILKVLFVSGKVSKVVVKGQNVVKKSQKPNPTLQIEGGIIDIEKPISASNVMHIDPKSNKPTRIGINKEANKRMRQAKKSKSNLK